MKYLKKYTTRLLMILSLLLVFELILFPYIIINTSHNINTINNNHISMLLNKNIRLTNTVEEIESSMILLERLYTFQKKSINDLKKEIIKIKHDNRPTINIKNASVYSTDGEISIEESDWYYRNQENWPYGMEKENAK